MKPKFIFQIMILALLVLSALVGCGSGVQVHENPGTTGNDTGSGVGTNGEDDGDVEASATQPLLSSFKERVCELVSNCYDIPTDVDCNAITEDDADLLEAFGVNANVYRNFTEVDEDIVSGILLITGTEASVCAGALDLVTCADMDANGVYNQNNRNDFSRVHLIVPVTECGGMI